MVELRNVVKTYNTGHGEVRALDGVDLSVKPGDFVVVRGPSGSGKTTLLLTIAAMLRPTSGTVIVAGRNLAEMSAREKLCFRGETIGFVFQMFHLVPYLSVVENVLLAAGGEDNHISRAAKLLDEFGMGHRASHKPSELSAGERQRTAIARALLNGPTLLLADEPTGNLDHKNARAVLDYLSDFHRAGGTVIVATHENVAESRASRVVSLLDGRVA